MLVSSFTSGGGSAAHAGAVLSPTDSRVDVIVLCYQLLTAWYKKAPLSIGSARSGQAGRTAVNHDRGDTRTSRRGGSDLLVIGPRRIMKEIVGVMPSSHHPIVNNIEYCQLRRGRGHSSSHDRASDMALGCASRNTPECLPAGCRQTGRRY